MAPVIEVRSLGKKYRDGTHAVRDVSFKVEKGEIFGLLGPNGAGKTTTMRMLGTLHRPSSGVARVLGLDPVTQAQKLRRRIGFAMQEVGMDDLATAWEMLMFHARLYGVPKAKAERRGKELLERFELWDHRNRRVTKFSGGMQRRLDLAVSIIHDPEVLFLDEPSTGLDPRSRSDLWDILRTLRRDHQLTIFMSTHYMDEADALCDRLAIMTKGQIAAIDTPENLKRAVGADRVMARLDHPAELAERDKLAQVFGRHNVTFEDNKIEVRVTNGEQALMPALTEIAKIGLHVKSTRVLSPTLDDVYLKYAGNRIVAGEP